MRLYDLQKKYPTLSKTKEMPSGIEVWSAFEGGIERLSHDQAMEILVYITAYVCPYTLLVLSLHIDDQSMPYHY